MYCSSIFASCIGASSMLALVECVEISREGKRETREEKGKGRNVNPSGCGRGELRCRIVLNWKVFFDQSSFHVLFAISVTIFCSGEYMILTMLMWCALLIKCK